MAVVSVISGAYRMEGTSTFRRSVESILTQTYTDFEFIVCDDGSDDGTYGILREYSERDGRLRVIRNERNLGLAASLNKCAEHSVAPILARHDLDDVSHPDRLARQVEYLSSHPDISILGCCAYVFDGDGIFGVRSFPERVDDRDFLFSSPYMHGAVVMRRDAFVASGGYSVERITRRTEDYELFMRMQSICNGGNLDECLYYYLEDRESEKRRKYRYRIDEAIVRARGFRSLGLYPIGIPYVLKPLAVGLLPRGLLRRIRRSRLGGDRVDG